VYGSVVRLSNSERRHPTIFAFAALSLGGLASTVAWKRYKVCTAQSRCRIAKTSKTHAA